MVTKIFRRAMRALGTNPLSQNPGSAPGLAIDRLKQRLEPQLEQRRCMRTSDAPYRAMLSLQQMASFGVHQEGLDDLPQQRGTRESLLPCVVQSRACAHNITGAGGQKFVPGSGAPPPSHVHHAQCMLHQLGATKWRRPVLVSV